MAEPRVAVRIFDFGTPSAVQCVFMFMEIRYSRRPFDRKAEFDLRMFTILEPRMSEVARLLFRLGRGREVSSPMISDDMRLDAALRAFLRRDRDWDDCSLKVRRR